MSGPFRRWLAAGATIAALAVGLEACTSSSPLPISAPASSKAGQPLSASASHPDSFTIAASGDLLIHLPVAKRAQAYGAASGHTYDFSPMLAKVRPLLSSADLAICHVETPMSPDDSDVSGYPVFSTPHELADAIHTAGYEGCSTASNHAIDRGMKGLTATLNALDRAKVAHAGTARDAVEATRPEIHRIGDVVVAHLSYTYGTNGIPAPAGAPWAVNITNVPQILADAHRVRQVGAQFVVVSIHWGEEYQTQPTAEQQAQARALLASPDIDLIFGCHVHVLQPVEKIGDKYVIYGMGNLLSNQSPAAGLPPKTQDGAIVKAYVSRHGERLVIDRVTYDPTFVEIGPYTVWPVAQALDNPSTPASLRSTLLASWRQTVANESSLPGHPFDVTPEHVPAAAR